MLLCNELHHFIINACNKYLVSFLVEVDAGSLLSVVFSVVFGLHNFQCLECNTEQDCLPILGQQLL